MSMETDRIEADLNESRHRLNDTLSALGSFHRAKCSMKFLAWRRAKLDSSRQSSGSQVKENRPTLLIAAGVGMLFLNRGNNGSNASNDDWHSESRYRSLEEARWSTPRNANESDDAYNDRVHMAYAKALDLKEMAGEATHAFKERVSKTVQGIQRRAGDVRARMNQTASDMSQYAQEQSRNFGAEVSSVSHRAQNLLSRHPAGSWRDRSSGGRTDRQRDAAE
ncbi:MAG: hypothetical protein IPG56_12330 [Caulobacteraceae bacterium]|nr:hypothetical protein [Caulobacteraceae bacterium]